MFTNYIFKGIGHAAGKYEVPNSMLEEAALNKVLDGFEPELVKRSKNYQAYLEQNPGATPFDYFVGYKMGFHKRHHVTPWPPRKKNQDLAENALDLAIEAVQNALDDAGIDAEEVDGWIVSTVSPTEQAPGIAATLKSYFTHPLNQASAMTLTSGCAGFNKSLRRALDHFKGTPEVKNIVIVHTETMSHFLNKKKDFVYHVTFGDAAAAAVISKQESDVKEGVLDIANHQDPLMIDFVGVDKDWNLYMNSGMVKRRAVPDLIKSSLEVMEKSKWQVDDIDMVVPHQTGNAILHSVAEEVNFPLDKLYQDAQYEYGNVSGTTIPIALSLLHHGGKLKPGMKILCPTAGVGGEYGAFTYIVPQDVVKSKVRPHALLKGQNILVLFADNPLGVEIIDQLLEVNAYVKVHLSNENDYSKTIIDKVGNKGNFEIVQKEISSADDAKGFVEVLKDEKYLSMINLSFVREVIYGFNDNAEMFSKVQMPYDMLTRDLLANISRNMIHVGHPIEKAALTSVEPLASTVSALHGLAGSMAGEAISRGVRTLWYIPAVYKSLTQNMPGKMKFVCSKGMMQDKVREDLHDIARNIVRSSYLLKVPQTEDHYEGPMIVRVEKCAFRI